MLPASRMPASRRFPGCIRSCCAGYWCRLWLAYMHVVLLGVDLLRMHHNKAYFKDIPFPERFLELLGKPLPPPLHGCVCKEEPPIDEQFMVLYDLSDADLYNLAACVATLLLRYRLWQEGGLKGPLPRAAAAEKVSWHMHTWTA